MMCLNNVVRCLLVPLVVALCLVFPACGGTVEPVDSGDVQLPDVVSDDGIDHGGSGDVDSGTDVGSDKINAVFDGPRRAWPGKSVPVSVTIDDPGYFGKMSVDACGSGIQIMVVRGRGSVLLSAPQEPGTCSVVVTQPGFRGSFDLEVSDGDVTEVAGTLPAELVEWPSGADILVTSDLVVPVGGTLWIGPSARIRLAHKVSLRIEGNLDVAATSDAPVHFLADSDDDDGGWGEIGVTGAAIIRNAWFTGAGSDDSRAFGHSGSQPVIRAGEGAFVEMIGGGIVDCPGKAFASQKATVILDGLMIARVDQGGEHKASKVEVRRSHFMHIPDDDGRPEDDDNDGIYLSDTEGTGPECLVQDCVFFQGEDDAIDHNGARVIIDRVFIRQFAHEGVAASKGRDVSIIDSVIMNCDQGIEAGYEGPKVHVRNCLLTGNGVGLRWGDSYEWQATGSIDVRDTVSVGNFRHNVLFEDDQQGPAPEGTATVACSMVDDTVFDGEDGNLPGIPLWNASGCVIDGVSGRPEGCGPLGPQLCDEPPPVIPVSVSVDSSD